MTKATTTKTVITLPCECGVHLATVESIETFSQSFNGKKFASVVEEIAFCNGCGIATIL